MAGNHKPHKMRINSRDKLKLEPKEELYIAFGDGKLDLSFFPGEVKIAERLWEEGYSVPDMGRMMNRDPDELGLLLLDRYMQGKIKPREGGLWGFKNLVKEQAC